MKGNGEKALRYTKLQTGLKIHDNRSEGPVNPNSRSHVKTVKTLFGSASQPVVLMKSSCHIFHSSLMEGSVPSTQGHRSGRYPSNCHKTLWHYLDRSPVFYRVSTQRQTPICAHITDHRPNHQLTEHACLRIV